MRFRLLLYGLTIAAFAPVAGTPWFQSDLQELAVPMLRDLRPLTSMTYGLIRGAMAAHLLQLGLHLACVLLAARLFEERLPVRAARIAACLFALHPLQSESVCSLSARPVLLAGCLCLASWECWRREKFWLSAVVFAAAPLAHEQAALFPAVLLLWGPRKRWPLAAMGAFSLLSLVRAQHEPHQLQPLGQLGIAALRDLWLFLLPIGLTPAPELRASPLAASLAWGAVAAVAVFAGASMRRSEAARWLLAALVLLVPVGFLATGAEAGSDRLMYLPMVGFAALAGWVFASAHIRVLGAVGLLLGVITVSQVLMWRDERAVWTEAVRLAPRSVRPRVRLAAISEPDQARELLEEAARLDP